MTDEDSRLEKQGLIDRITEFLPSLVIEDLKTVCDQVLALYLDCDVATIRSHYDRQ